MTGRNRSLKSTANGEFYEFTVDAALLKELGERLVGKPYVALAELVKNAYDADATSVRISFEPDAIEIVDNGDGMSRSEFKKFWMRVGTTHKQDSPLTARFKRQVSGSKGVGRLSVQFLGNTLKLWSISRNSTGTAFRAEVDWQKAQRSSSLVKSGAHVYKARPSGILPQGFKHGTRLRIEGLNQEWDSDSLRGLARELWFLRPPALLRKDLKARDRFDVSLEGAAEKEHKAFNEQLDKAFSSWIAEIEGSIENGRKGKQASVTVRFSDGHAETQSFPLGNTSSLDRARFLIRVYKLSGKQAGGISVGDAREYFRRYGGVHIYDQNFRLPFYGGEGEDWLRLEYDHSHRLMVSKLVPDDLKGRGDLRDLPTNGRVFGVVQVSTNHERDMAPQDARRKGAYLNVQVTRDRFIENEAMDALRRLVRWGFDYYAYLSSARKYRRSASDDSDPIQPTDPFFDEIRQRLSDLASEVPATAARLEQIATKIQAVHDIEQQREKRFDRERILLGALATAGMGAIALEHELGKEITALNTAIDDLSALPRSPQVRAVHGRLTTLAKRISDARRLLSPLMEPENRDRIASLKAKDLIDGVVSDLRPLLRSIKVDTTGIDPGLRLPPATRAAWMAILQNVIVNSVNATIDTDSKKIRIRSRIDRNGATARILVEDNGIGVDLDEAKELFEPFERRLELSPDRKRLGLGGVGLGLTIVRMVAESIRCEVGFIDPPPSMATTFEISWRTKDVNQAVPDRHHRRRA